MASKPQHRLPANPIAGFATRRGEGEPVEVAITQVPTVSGGFSTGFALNFATATVPDRRYYADTCVVIRARSVVKIPFAQVRISDDTIRSMIAVQMPCSSARQFIEAIDATKEPSYSELAAQHGIVIDELPKLLKEPTEPAAVAFAANAAVTAIAGDAAVIDFYQLSPFVAAAMQKVPNTRTMGLEPVVRVDLATSLFLGMLAALRKAIEDVPPSSSGNWRSLSHERV